MARLAEVLKGEWLTVNGRAGRIWLYLIIISDYFSRMKVKIGELKAHFSRYVRDLQKHGEPIEVCVREKPVAYLTTAEQPAHDGFGHAELTRMVRQFEAAGLRWFPAPAGSLANFKAAPVTAGDDRADVKTVERMRAERDW